MTSLLHKVLLSSLLVILLPVGLAILWTSNTFPTLLERRFAEKSKAQAERVKLLLAEKQEIATGLVNWIAVMPGVKKQLERIDDRRRIIVWLFEQANASVSHHWLGTGHSENR